MSSSRNDLRPPLDASETSLPGSVSTRSPPQQQQQHEPGVSRPYIDGVSRSTSLSNSTRPSHGGDTSGSQGFEWRQRFSFNAWQDDSPATSHRKEPHATTSFRSALPSHSKPRPASARVERKAKFAETGLQGVTGSAGIGTGVVRFHQVTRQSSNLSDRQVAWLTGRDSDGDGSLRGHRRISAEMSRRRWSSAIGTVRNSTRKIVLQRRARRHVWADIKSALRSFVVFAGLVVTLGTLLYLIEGDEIYEQTKDKFVFADRLHREYCAWMGAVYISYLAAHRVGFGDILVTTTGGKAAVMFFATACTPMSVIFTMKCGVLLKKALDIPASRYFQKYGRKALDAFYILSTFGLLILLMLLNMLCLIFVKDDDGESLSPTDALWFSWSMFTTVGYGDISFATLPKVTVGTWVMEYCFFVAGAVMMDTLISWAFLLSANLESDVQETHGQNEQRQELQSDTAKQGEHADPIPSESPNPPT